MEFVVWPGHVLVKLFAGKKKKKKKSDSSTSHSAKGRGAAHQKGAQGRVIDLSNPECEGIIELLKNWN